jgi:hypothetical protein
MGKRPLSSWNIFVKKVFSEGKSKNPSYKFMDALKDASKRKGEMSSILGKSVKKSKKSLKSKKSRKTKKSRD